VERDGVGVVIAWTIVLLLILVVFVFAAIRVTTDAGNILSNTVPDPADFEHRYAVYPWLAYAHIVPGVVYLTLAPLQLWRGFRSRDLTRHRRIGRAALCAGGVSGVFAVVFGLTLSFGGWLQASASVVFGTYFVVALVVAYRAIRRGDVPQHRRWMIRGFAVALAVGTIRIWIGLFEGLGVFDLRQSFAVAFWLAFVSHVAAAELWLSWRPSPRGADPGARAIRPVGGAAGEADPRT
jgi:uncharacterized membrane protein YozB (DUF420 family)